MTRDGHENQPPEGYRLLSRRQAEKLRALGKGDRIKKHPIQVTDFASDPTWNPKLAERERRASRRRRGGTPGIVNRRTRRMNKQSPHRKARRLRFEARHPNARGEVPVIGPSEQPDPTPESPARREKAKQSSPGLVKRIWNKIRGNR